MTERIFPTAQDVENAFYEALERADVDAMMSVWSEDDDIVCVHPAGQRLTGQAQVRDAWRQMFAAGPHLRVQVAAQVVISGMMLEVRSVQEHVTLAGERRARAPMIATNVYARTASGWRMIAHHASPSPPEPAAGAPSAPAPAGTPKILH